jgi:phosphoribosylamine--glycine ligase
LDCDVLELLWRASIGQLAGFDLQENDQHAMCVVIASRGYPESYPKGDVINLPDPLPANVALIQAGTANNDAGQLVTAGGRVLGVTALADSLKSAADLAYSTCEQIDCVSKVYRRDIGARQFNRE